MKTIPYLYLALMAIACSCKAKPTNTKTIAKEAQKPFIKNNVCYDTSFKTIHIFVALCDNKYQGIIPVPALIGNGQDLNENLYWGCSYGVRGYFKNSKSWTLIRRMKVDSVILERLVFKNKNANYYLVADAYNGKYIKQCTIDLLNSCAGKLKDTLHIDQKTIGIYGNARLLVYTGHDGLMDFRLNESFQNTDSLKRDVIILACKSKQFFSKPLLQTKAFPLVWTTDLMCPEAYTVHDAINGYINKETNVQIQLRAATAYSNHQHCSVKAAKNLLVTGW